MPSSFAPFAALLVIIALATPLGIAPIRKLIVVKEAKHELKQGSAGFLLSLSGWIIIAVWGFGTWFCATILGDWWATGDLDGAILRSGRRLELILHILSALADD